jgi:hypothetical protein
MTRLTARLMSKIIDRPKPVDRPNVPAAERLALYRLLWMVGREAARHRRSEIKKKGKS